MTDYTPDPGWVRLDDAARTLGLPSRELSERLFEQRKPVRRVRVGDDWVSLVLAADMGLDENGRRIAAAPEAPRIQVGDASLARMREVEAQRDALELALNDARRELTERREREQLATEQWRALEIDLEDTRSRLGIAERQVAALEAHVRSLEHSLANERAQREQFERELTTLRYVEMSRESYCDRLEQKLRDLGLRPRDVA